MQKKEAVCPETEHLLSNPRNAERLLRSIHDIASDRQPNRLTCLAMEEARKLLERMGTKGRVRDDDHLDVPEN